MEIRQGCELELVRSGTCLSGSTANLSRSGALMHMPATDKPVSEVDPIYLRPLIMLPLTGHA